jgi:hypothetical protein
MYSFILIKGSREKSVLSYSFKRHMKWKQTHCYEKVLVLLDDRTEIVMQKKESLPVIFNSALELCRTNEYTHTHIQTQIKASLFI